MYRIYHSVHERHGAVRKETEMKKIMICILCLAVFASTVGCAGAGDYKSEPLIGGYEVWRISADDVKLVKPDETGTLAEEVIGPKVIKVCWNDRYICVQQRPDEKDAEVCFIILDTETGEVSGPFGEEEYTSETEDLCITGLCEWTKPEKLPRR